MKLAEAQSWCAESAARPSNPLTLCSIFAALTLLGSASPNVARCADAPATAAALAAVAAPAAGSALLYNRDVRPILSSNCFRCHGPDSASRKADLRLDRREAAVEAGAIVPGDADESSLVARIFSEDPEALMPPEASHLTLSADEKQTLKRWVQEGAAYQPQWSLIAPERSPLPEVTDAAWPRGAIDRFVLADLEAQGLTPAPEGDRRTLARRLSLDLTGLPPSVELVESFIDDASDQAYENLVEKLLASDRWGEHRARYWLDSARYADTHGIHFDNFREMWSYRDWVIQAFNRNQPYDQFTIEQLAGDLLPASSLDQQVASGFNRCNMTTNEGGVIPEEYLVLYTRDRIETTSAVWMGLTAGCAVCHDHKFDPISQREFYEMAAFFNNTTQGAMDGNIKDTPPIVTVPPASDRPRWDALPGEIAQAQAARDARHAEARVAFDSWLSAADMNQLAALVPQEELRVLAPLAEGDGSTLTLTVDNQARELNVNEIGWSDGHVSAKACTVAAGAISVPDAGDFERDQAFSCAAWIKLANVGQAAAIVARMDDQHAFRGWDMWLEGGRVGAHVVSQWPDDALKVVSKAALEANKWTHVAVSYDGSGKAAGVQVYFNGVRQDADAVADKLASTIRTEVPFRVGQRSSGQQLQGLTIQDIRLYGKSLPANDVNRLAQTTRALWLASKPADTRVEAETSELFEWWLGTLDEPYRASVAKVAALEGEKATIASRGTIAHIMNERNEAAMAYILNRGEYDQRRDELRPATPKFLPAMGEQLPRNRLGFAQWLLAPEHPLTARVTVNRFWQEVFGAGIVRTSGDFGVAGEMPSNQALLDWLAIEFRESGWDVKQLFRLMVTSAAYRQAAVVTAEKLEKDPHNRLLSRGPRFRMDAEMVRDYALAASDLLSARQGGPSVRPYQPEGVWEAVAMIGSNTRDYRVDSGEDIYRRSMYTFWKRAVPPASMDIFNAPSREQCTTRRERTNTPLQALVTLNDTQFVEAARVLAQLVIERGGQTTEGRLDLLARRLLARPLADKELAVVRKSLAELQAYYTAHADQARELIQVGTKPADPNLDPVLLASWTMLANELLNLDEVLNK